MSNWYVQLMDKGAYGFSVRLWIEDKSFLLVAGEQRDRQVAEVVADRIRTAMRSVAAGHEKKGFER